MSTCKPSMNIKVDPRESTVEKYKTSSFSASDFKSYNSQMKRKIEQSQ